MPRFDKLSTGARLLGRVRLNWKDASYFFSSTMMTCVGVLPTFSPMWVWASE
jgi:hypothetical protein